MFSCEYYEIFKNTYFEQYLLRMAASTIRHTPDKQALSDVGKRKLTPVEPNKSLLALHANRSS